MKRENITKSIYINLTLSIISASWLFFNIIVKMEANKIYEIFNSVNLIFLIILIVSLFLKVILTMLLMKRVK